MSIMHYFNCLVLIAHLVLGSSLSVIRDRDGKSCRVVSENNHGCSGYSAVFATREGKSCTNFISGESSDDSVEVDICGTEDGVHVAWVTVNTNGTVSFINHEGETASCSLGNGLKIGSKCDTENSTSSQPPASLPTNSKPTLSTTNSKPTCGSLTEDHSSSAVSTQTRSSESSASSSASQVTSQVPSPTFPSIPACTCTCTPVAV